MDEDDGFDVLSVLRRRMYREEELMMLLEDIVNIDDKQYLYTRRAMRQTYEIVASFFRGSFRKLDLRRYQEYVVRSIACCGKARLLLEIAKEHRGNEIFPWDEYLDWRFPAWEESHLKSLKAVLGNCGFFFALLIVDSNEDYYEHGVPAYQIQHTSEVKNVFSSSSSSKLLDIQHVLELDSQLMFYPSHGHEEFKNPSEGSDQAEMIQRPMEETQPEDHTSQHPKVRSLVDLCIDCILEHCLDWTSQPTAITDRILQRFRCCEDDIVEIKLEDLPLEVVRFLVQNLSKAELVCIKRENRGKGVLPWDEFCVLRFGDELNSPENVSLRQLLDPCEVFYAVLVRQS